jgi:hypothetical protein
VTGDGAPEVLFGSSDLVGYDGAGAQVWAAAEGAETSDSSPWSTVSDLDGDGAAEVIHGSLVADGRTGATELRLPVDDENFAVADLDRDGRQEIIFPGIVVDADGNVMWLSNGDGWPVILQADADPEAEVAFVGDTIIFLDHDGTTLASPAFADTIVSKPCAGDLDGDGIMEVVVPSFLAVFAFEPDGTLLWQADADEAYGGCTVFDFDGDGALEVVTDEASGLVVRDGAAGTDRMRIAAVGGRGLATVADVDRDGHADLLVSGLEETGEFSVVEHAGDGWAPAPGSWPIDDHAMTQVLPDGSVAASPEPSWSTYGVFRGNAAVYGAPFADLTVAITAVCVADCDYGPVEVGVQVANRGAADVLAGAVLTLYAIDAV